MRVVKDVAMDPEEDPQRRTAASWQYALFHIRTLQLDPKSDPLIDESLEFLLQAADGGHKCARSIASHLFETLDREFPRSRTIELEWLHEGICNGSGTAKRRLQSISPVLCAEALNQLRTRYVGIGIEAPQHYYDHSSWPDDYFLFEARHRQASGAQDSQLVLGCAGTNRLELLRTLTAEGLVDVNLVNEWGESPLLWACRAGHRDIALHLLKCGADPSIASVEGTTPLHFLSTFDAQYIPEICERLLKAGADIESRSRGGQAYRQLFDSTFGDADGTPLTWAVSANNKAATETLVARGADPFDWKGLDVPYTDNFGDVSHVSPIAYAALRHQDDLLDIMLRNTDRLKVKHFLNSYRRGYGSANIMAEHDLPIIGWCATYAGQGIGMRLLLHGKAHQHAFRRTFEILADYGSDLTGILDMAVLHGQPFVIDYLIGAQGVLIPRPTASQWLSAVQVAATNQDWIVFDTLLRHSQADDITPEEWKRYHESLESLPDNIQYLNPFRKYRDPTEDCYLHYANALMAGKFQLAEWFYETGLCDLSRQISKGRTLLGTLIARSKSYSNALVQLEQLLKLSDLPDSMFWDVAKVGDSKFTALQLAAYFPEYRSNSTMAKTVIRTITDKWYESEHINAQIVDGEFTGRTALHIATLTANVGAVRYLLDEERETVDLALLDGNNFSILDTAAWGLGSQEGRIKLWGELPSRVHKAVDLDHWERAVEIICTLLKAGAKPHKIGMAVTRTEQDKVLVFDLQASRPIIIPFSKYNPNSVILIGCHLSLLLTSHLRLFRG
jgi:hypothetical protein